MTAFDTRNQIVDELVYRIQCRTTMVRNYGTTVKGVTITDAKFEIARIRGMIDALRIASHNPTTGNDYAGDRIVWLVQDLTDATKAAMHALRSRNTRKTA
jgi:hypothetical protein